MSELSEPANDHAAAHRHREPTFAPAQSSGLHSVNVAIALSQALRSAEAVSRAITYAQGPAAAQAARRVLDEPELLFPAAASRTNEIGPRAAVFENGVGDADELFFVTEGDDAMPVLKSDSARGLEARCGEAEEFVKENAAVRVASAFRHEF